MVNMNKLKRPAIGIDNVEVIDLEAVTDDSDSLAREAHWIARLIEEGHPVVNRIARDGVPRSHAEVSTGLIGDRNRGNVPWIAGRTGEAAGWTEERRRAQADRIRAVNAR